MTPHHLPKKRGVFQSTQISFLRAPNFSRSLTISSLTKRLIFVVTSIPTLRQVHQEEKVKANSTIPKPCHVSHIKGKGEDSKWTPSHAKGKAY